MEPVKTIDPKKVKFIPTGDRVLIQPDTAESVTEGGILIPDTAKERPQRGTIIEVGEGRNNQNEILSKLNAILLKLDPAYVPDYRHVKYVPGMRVMYGRNAGSEIDYNKQKVLIMRFSDIAGIITEE